MTLRLSRVVSRATHQFLIIFRFCCGSTEWNEPDLREAVNREVDVGCVGDGPQKVSYVSVLDLGESGSSAISLTWIARERTGSFT